MHDFTVAICQNRNIWRILADKVVWYMNDISEMVKWLQILKYNAIIQYTLVRDIRVKII